MAAVYGWRVKELAEAKGFTITTLNRAADVHYRTIEQLWKGYAERPDIRVLQKIANVLGVKIADLMPDEVEVNEA